MTHKDRKQAVAIELMARLQVTEMVFMKLTPESTNSSSNEEELDYEGLFWLFDILSDTFFNGELKMNKNVIVTWENGEAGCASESFAYIAPPGATLESGRQYAMTRISLNRDLCSLKTSNREGKALAALIHEMVHAYFVIHCGVEDGEDIHDVYFRSVMVCISDIFREINPEVADLLLLSVGWPLIINRGRPVEHCSWRNSPEYGYTFATDIVFRVGDRNTHPELFQKADEAATAMKALAIETKEGKGKAKMEETKKAVSKMKKLFKRG
ncbi:hypothetical protein KEM54_006984 [Ascosphaera aggregata]|nr:hypothetical protein KEM54_006984 [Ascosphaera aggregata]